MDEPRTAAEPEWTDPNEMPPEIAVRQIRDGLEKGLTLDRITPAGVPIFHTDPTYSSVRAARAEGAEPIAVTCHNHDEACRAGRDDCPAEPHCRSCGATFSGRADVAEPGDAVLDIAAFHRRMEGICDDMDADPWASAWTENIRAAWRESWVEEAASAEVDA